MITGEKMMELVALAQDKYPLTAQHIALARMTGSLHSSGLIEQRVLWMLSEAFEMGYNKGKEVKG